MGPLTAVGGPAHGPQSDALPNGARISDQVSLGILTATVPAELIDAVLADTGRQSQRQRQLPARLVVYYVMALALYAQASYGEVLRGLLEGVRWLRWAAPSWRWRPSRPSRGRGSGWAQRRYRCSSSVSPIPSPPQGHLALPGQSEVRRRPKLSPAVWTSDRRDQVGEQSRHNGTA